MEKIYSSNTHASEPNDRQKGYPRTTSSGGICMYTPVCTDVKSELLEELILKSVRISLKLLTTDEGEGETAHQVDKFLDIMEVLCVFRKWYLADSGSTCCYKFNITDAGSCRSGQ